MVVSVAGLSNLPKLPVVRWLTISPGLFVLSFLVVPIIPASVFPADGIDPTCHSVASDQPTKFEWHMNGNGDDNLAYDADIPADVWMHHAVVKDGGSLTYYRDGVEASAGVFTQAMGFAQPLFLGGDNEGASGENWRGMLSDVRTYDHALSASDVAALVPEPSSIVLALAVLLALVGLARPARRKS